MYHIDQSDDKIDRNYNMNYRSVALDDTGRVIQHLQNDSLFDEQHQVRDGALQLRVIRRLQGEPQAVGQQAHNPVVVPSTLGPAGHADQPMDQQEQEANQVILDERRRDQPAADD